MYSQDSFHTLSAFGQVGLLVLSAALSGALIVLVWRLAAGRALMVRLLLALLLWVGFIWLSPQVYYTYYLFLFDGLPLQWVARGPQPGALARLLAFSGPATLSAHGAGLLGWAMLGCAAAARRRKCRDAAN